MEPASAGIDPGTEPTNNDKANFKTAIRPASVNGAATGIPGRTGYGGRSRVIEGDPVRRGHDEKPRRRYLTKLTR